MDDLTTHRDAAAEASGWAPPGTVARVLEPSPPAVTDADFWADDPIDPAAIGPTSLVPFARHPRGGPTWREVAADDAELAAFAETRWLGPWPKVAAVPDDYVEARQDFHRLAYAAVAAARHQANGKFGLRFTAGGFGTPFFGDDRQVRVVGNVLVDQSPGSVRSTQPSTIDDAVAFLSVRSSTVAAEHDSPELGPTDRPLLLSESTGAFLADWFGFATSVLEEFRAFAEGDAEVGRVQLWPGHFDPAVEVGNQAAGRRATYGASPGDGGSAEPYLYVGPWAGTSDDAFWNATSFGGAVLTHAELLDAADPRRKALEFFWRATALLEG